MSTTLPLQRRLPPIWVLGLCNLPFGMFGAAMLMTIPQLLAARGVPQPYIASVTAIGLSAGFAYILAAPILDVRLSRRTYAYVFGILLAVLVFLALEFDDDLTLLSILLFGGQFATALYSSAIGGWFGSLVAPEDEARLGAWFTIGSFAGYGITGMVAILLLRAIPFALGAGLLSLLVLSPVLLFSLVPAPGPDRRLARESFGRFLIDVLDLLRRPAVLRTLPFFLTPCASFALTNTLGALGNDYHASEAVAGIVCGIGTSIAGVAGSLFVPPLAKYFALRPLYLLVGSVGALFTLLLVGLPHTPGMFMFAVLGENLFGAAATAIATAIIFDTIGKNNPLAATQFAVLYAAILVPVTYMQALDGVGYGWEGLAGNFIVDATLSLAACGTLAIAMSIGRRKRRKVIQPSPVLSEVLIEREGAPMISEID